MTMRIVSGILAVVVVVVGVLYGTEVGKLNKANDNVASLEGQLTTEQAHAADLQTQLTAANANVTSLSAELAAVTAKASSLTADLATANTNLTTANSRVSTLTADLATANARIATLTTDLATANTRITTLNATIATLTTQVTSLNTSLAIASNNASNLNTELRKVKDPRHFNSTTELADWLAQDDTNTRYASENILNRAYILQVRALRDGYLLPAVVRVEGTTKYVSNQALIGNAIYNVISSNDQYWLETTAPAFPSHPLPLP